MTMIPKGNAIHKTEKIVLEAGFRQAYTPPPRAEDLPVIPAEQSRLQQLRKRQRVTPQAVRVQRQVTPPEPGLSEVALLRTLQAHGLGRPATYAGIVELLLQREYVTQDAAGELCVTTRGKQVCEFLTETYPQIFAPAYTARMEAALDALAAGKRSYQAVLREFWAELKAEIQP